MPPAHLKKSFNQSRLKNVTNEEIVNHFGRQLEITVLEAAENCLVIKVIKKTTAHNPKKEKTLDPFEKCIKSASLFISQSIAEIFDQKLALQKTNTTESPYINKKKILFAEFDVVAP